MTQFGEVSTGNLGVSHFIRNSRVWNAGTRNGSLRNSHHHLIALLETN